MSDPTVTLPRTRAADETVVLRAADTVVMAKTVDPPAPRPKPVEPVRILRYAVAVATGTYWALLIGERLGGLDPHLSDWFGGAAFWVLAALALWTRWSA